MTLRVQGCQTHCNNQAGCPCEERLAARDMEHQPSCVHQRRFRSSTDDIMSARTPPRHSRGISLRSLGENNPMLATDPEKERFRNRSRDAMAFPEYRQNTVLKTVPNSTSRNLEIGFEFRNISLAMHLKGVVWRD